MLGPRSLPATPRPSLHDNYSVVHYRSARPFVLAHRIWASCEAPSLNRIGRHRPPRSSLPPPLPFRVRWSCITGSSFLHNASKAPSSTSSTSFLCFPPPFLSCALVSRLFVLLSSCHLCNVILGLVSAAIFILSSLFLRLFLPTATFAIISFVLVSSLFGHNLIPPIPTQHCGATSHPC